MKRILVINGSPKGEKSNTLRVTDAFIDGMKTEAECSVKNIILKDRDIHPCRGCFTCWRETPGKCVIRDDMDEIFEAVAESDIIIESFPLYFFGMPSKLKAMTDRTLPLMLPYEGKPAVGEGRSFHEPRYDYSDKKFVIISSCGYVQTDRIYEALLREYDLICGEGRYTALLCAEGEMLGVGQLEYQCGLYLKNVSAAGAEFIRDGKISADTYSLLKSPIIPGRALERILTMHWNMENDGAKR